MRITYKNGYVHARRYGLKAYVGPRPPCWPRLAQRFRCSYIDHATFHNEVEHCLLTLYYATRAGAWGYFWDDVIISVIPGSSVHWLLYGGTND